MKVSYLLLKVIINKLPFWVQVRSNIIKNVFLESVIFWLLYLYIFKYLNDKYISINSEIIIKDVIDRHLGWLVIWGGVFGGIIGGISFYVSSIILWIVFFENIF